MTEKAFSTKEAVAFGWHSVFKDIKFFLLFALIAFIVNFVPEFIITNMNLSVLWPSLVLNIVMRLAAFLLSLVISLAFITVGLKTADNQPRSLGDFFSSISRYGAYLAGAVIYTLVVIAGMILLIVPGVIWAIQYMFFGYFIVDQKLDAIASLQASARITKGLKGQLFLFVLVLLLINIAGMMAAMVGILITMPLTIIAVAWLYRRLNARYESLAGKGAEGRTA